MKPNERLKSLREKLGLSPNDMATKLGVMAGTYYDLEDVEHELQTNISLADLQKLSSLLGSTPRYIKRSL